MGAVTTVAPRNALLRVVRQSPSPQEHEEKTMVACEVGGEQEIVSQHLPQEQEAF